jgi:hypothetical protein
VERQQKENSDKSIECGTIASGRPGQELSFKTVLLAAAAPLQICEATKATGGVEGFLLFGGKSFFSWAVIPLPMFHC